jgi:membrane-bound lytic murein transglycosylase C
VKLDYERLLSLLQDNVGKQWGKKEAKIPTNKQYVKYTQNYQSRAVVATFGGELRARREASQEREASLAYELLNRMLELGRPHAYPAS